MIKFRIRKNTTDYLRFVDAHQTGYEARIANKSREGLIFVDKPQQLGFKAGWDMGGLPLQIRQAYWLQHNYWQIWDMGGNARFDSIGYKNPYPRGSWQWRAYLAGWCAKNYQHQA